MGEKIRDIKTIYLGNNKLLIEENKGTHKGSKYDIHIQNEHFRLNVSDKDFFKIAAAILYAGENFCTYKDLINAKKGDS